MDTDHLAFVHFGRVTDEQTTTVLQTEQGVGQGLAGCVGDQYAVLTLTDVATLVRTVVVEGVVQQTGTWGQGHELGLEADQATARDHEVEANTALAIRGHVGHFAFTQTQLFHDGTLVCFFHVHGYGFERFLQFAIDGAQDNFRTGYRQLVAFATHVFDQDGEVQFTTTGYAELVRIIGLFHAQGHVVDQLLVQTLQDVAGGHELAFFTGERRGVDLEGHVHGRLVNGERRQRFNGTGVADGVGDLQLAQTGDGDDVARLRVGHFGTGQTQVTQHLANLAITGLAIGADHGHLLVGLDATTGDAADTDNAHVGVVVQLGDLHLECAVGVSFRRFHVVDDGLEQGFHVLGRSVQIHGGPTVQCRGVNNFEVQLLVGGTQVVEQVEYLIHYPVRTGTRTVNLVDHHDRLQTLGKCLLGHETGLRHRAVYRVNQQQHGVNHGEYALNFTTEVGVTWGIHDVDAVVVPADRSVLGENGDATFPFQIIGVHDPFLTFRGAVQGTGLLQQLVHQRGFAVVNVRNNRNIA